MDLCTPDQCIRCPNCGDYVAASMQAEHERDCVVIDLYAEPTITTPRQPFRRQSRSALDVSPSGGVASPSPPPPVQMPTRKAPCSTRRSKTRPALFAPPPEAPPALGDGFVVGKGLSHIRYDRRDRNHLPPRPQSPVPSAGAGEGFQGGRLVGQYGEDYGNYDHLGDGEDMDMEGEEPNMGLPIGEFGAAPPAYDDDSGEEKAV